jgi:amidase
VGFKPSFGELPTAGVFPFASTLDTLGIMTRSVDDVVCVHSALTHDFSGARAGDAPPLLVRLDVGSLTTSSVERHLDAALERAEAAGARVERGTLPVDLDLVLHVHRVLVHASAYQVHGRMLEQRPTLYGPRLARTVRLGALVPPDVYARALALQQQLSAGMVQALPKGAVFVLPTASSAPDMTSTGDPRLQSIASTLGLPAITIPTGRDDHGLPLGTQLVGSYGQDVELLAAASWFEAYAGTGLQDLVELWRVLDLTGEGTRSDHAAAPSSTTVAGFL